jgi:hypothetical protein
MYSLHGDGVLPCLFEGFMADGEGALVAHFYHGPEAGQNENSDLRRLFEAQHCLHRKSPRKKKGRTKTTYHYFPTQTVTSQTMIVEDD